MTYRARYERHARGDQPGAAADRARPDRRGHRAGRGLPAARRRGARSTSLADLGRLAGSEQAQEWGRVANENPPKLRTHDRYGHRIDEVEFHPYWHELMRTAVENGLAGAPWARPTPGPRTRTSAAPWATSAGRRWRWGTAARSP